MRSIYRSQISQFSFWEHCWSCLPLTGCLSSGVRWGRDFHIVQQRGGGRCKQSCLLWFLLIAERDFSLLSLGLGLYLRGVQTLNRMRNWIQYWVRTSFVSVFESSRHCFPIQTWSFSSLLEAIVGVSKQKARHVIHAAVRRLTRRPRGLTLVLNFFTTCSWEP